MAAQPLDITLDAQVANALAPNGAVQSSLTTAWPELLGIYVFGSHIQGNANSESDLDLAVLLPGYAASSKLWEIAGQLSDSVGCAVDLLDLRAASTVMQYQVLMRGKKLWSMEPAAGLFEAFVLSEYTQLGEARAGLLADIAKNGLIYG